MTYTNHREGLIQFGNAQGEEEGNKNVQNEQTLLNHIWLIAFLIGCDSLAVIKRCDGAICGQKEPTSDQMLSICKTFKDQERSVNQTCMHVHKD